MGQPYHFDGLNHMFADLLLTIKPAETFELLEGRPTIALRACSGERFCTRSPNAKGPGSYRQTLDFGKVLG